jgi:hypothetical protein
MSLISKRLLARAAFICTISREVVKAVAWRRGGKKRLGAALKSTLAH